MIRSADATLTPLSGGEAGISAEAVLVKEGSYMRAKFVLDGASLEPVSNNRDGTTTIRFELYAQDGTTVVDTINGEWFTRNNSNVLFDEVLAGKAVYTIDTSPWAGRDNHISKNSADGSVKRFQYVEELINQVVPRKRSVSGFSYIDEDGLFGNEAYLPILKLKNNFKIDNLQTSNRKNSFYKLKKDYAFTNDNYWAYRMVDKELLVGATHTQDTQINETTAGDVGLYELYKNVVEVFVDSMIAEADRYASDEVTDQWVSRRGFGPEQHGAGMSYCFGCKQSIDEFNTTVVNCNVESNTEIKARADDDNSNQICNLPTDQNPNPYVPQCVFTYFGNVSSSCHVMENERGIWPGLKKSELINDSVQYRSFKNIDWRAPGGYRALWAGIDCSGLVKRALKSSVNVSEQLGHHISTTIPLSPFRSRARDYFHDYTYDQAGVLVSVSDTNQVYFKAIDDSTPDKKRLKKGDLLRYGIRHVSIVTKSNIGSDEDYEIIHAYGGSLTGYQGGFDRKVIKMRKSLIDEGRLDPDGFGRITLWD